jgi:hypothetical protein
MHRKTAADVLSGEMLVYREEQQWSGILCSLSPSQVTFGVNIDIATSILLHRKLVSCDTTVNLINRHYTTAMRQVSMPMVTTGMYVYMYDD